MFQAFLDKQQALRDNYYRKPNNTNSQIAKYLENKRKAEEEEETNKNKSFGINTKPKPKSKPKSKPPRICKIQEPNIDELEYQLALTLLDDEEDEKEDEKELAELEQQLTLALLHEEARKEKLAKQAERRRIWHKEWREKNAEEYKQRLKDKYHNNKEAVSARVRAYQATDKYKQWKKEYVKTEEYKSYHNEYMRLYRIKKKQLG